MAAPGAPVASSRPSSAAAAAGPPPVSGDKRRWDDTAVQPPATARPTLAGAVAIVQNDLKWVEALAAFDAALLAPGTSLSLNSRLNTATRLLHEALGADLLPLDVAKIRALGAALKAAGYKSAKDVLETVKAEHLAANFA